MPDSSDDQPRPATPRRPQVRLTRQVAAGLTVLVAVAVVAVIGRGGAPAASTPSPSIGAAITSTSPGSFILPRLGGGGVVRLTDFRGRPLVLNFFASWCDPCRAELPGFSTVSRQLAGRVAFAGVDSLETGDGLGFARQFGIGGWPLARDIGGQDNSGLHDALGGTGMPMTAFYDGQGRQASVHVGQISEPDLLGDLHRLFGISV